MDKVAMLSQILEQNPADTFARYGLAMEYIAQTRQAEGLAEFDRIIAANPDYVPAYQMAAQTEAGANPERALELLHAGIAAANRTGNQHALAEMEALREELAAR